MLEIVDADLRCFPKTDRAKMSGHLESTFVCFFDGRAQFSTGDVHVSFERSSAFVSPKVDHLPRIFGATELVHHGRERPSSLEIWSCDMHLGSDHAACIDKPLDFKIGEGHNAAGSANRCDAQSQVQTRKAYAHVGI